MKATFFIGGNMLRLVNFFKNKVRRKNKVVNKTYLVNEHQTDIIKLLEQKRYKNYIKYIKEIKSFSGYELYYTLEDNIRLKCYAYLDKENKINFKLIFYYVEGYKDKEWEWEHLFVHYLPNLDSYEIQFDDLGSYEKAKKCLANDIVDDLGINENSEYELEIIDFPI